MHFVERQHIPSLNPSYQSIPKLGRLQMLLTIKLGRVDHIGQARLRLLPLSCLQPAIRVDPELIWTQILQHLLNPIFDLLLTRNSRGVDIVDPWTDLAGVSLIDEDFEKLGIALAVLNAKDVGIKGSDGLEEVLEFRVTEMRVDLSGIGYARDGETKGFDGPGEVIFALETCA